MAGRKRDRVTLRDQRTPDGNLSRLEACVESDGSLVLEGYDLGPSVEAFWGDSDYEYWRRVRAGDVPGVLRELLRDRFGAAAPTSAWLRQRGLRRRAGDRALLLELIRERFDSESAFSSWLADKGIESTFESWV